MPNNYNEIKADTVQTVTLVRTTLTRAGSGADIHSPLRYITQYWTPCGKLVAEVDPCACHVSPELRKKQTDAAQAEFKNTIDTLRDAFNGAQAREVANIYELAVLSKTLPEFIRELQKRHPQLPQGKQAVKKPAKKAKKPSSARG